MKIMLAPQSYESRSASVNGQRLVNLYAEPNQEGAKYPFTLYGTPGLSTWLDLGTVKGVDGMQVMGGVLYAVSGNTVFKVTEAAVKTTVGTITGIEGRVDLANNGTQMVAVTQSNQGWVITSASVAQITDPDFPSVTSVDFLDGYHLFTKASTGQFVISDLYNATAYDALDIATAEASPDNNIKGKSYNSNYWIFGENSYQVFYNSGNQDFPFEQMSGAVNTKRGLAAKFSVVEEDNGLFILGDDKIFYRFDGYSPKRVSTHAVETAIAGYTTISDAFGFSYTENGHKFACWTFPTERVTWCFDIATGMWHERSTLVDGVIDRWRANCCVYFAGKNLIGDYQNGKIYEMNLNIYTDNAGTLQRIAQGGVVWSDAERLTVDELHLDMDTGVGLVTGQGSNPQVVMDYSVNGTKTWSNERWRSFGAIGDYGVRAIWRRCGTARQKIFRFTISDPVKVIINGCYASGRKGRT